MKRVIVKTAIILSVVAVFLLAIPGVLLAQSAGISIDEGTPGEETYFNIEATGYYGSNYYFGIVDYEGSVDEFWSLSQEEMDKYLLYTFEGYIDSEDWTSTISVKLAAGEYYAGLLMSEPYYKNLISMERFTVANVVPEMKCYQIWINEDNNFEFIFWYLNGSDNWVKIYDMEENLVFEKDLEYGQPVLEVELPDGFYNVKTFSTSDKPIQEFLIGKP